MEVKKATTYEEQLYKLESRGCIVSNKEKAIQALGNINYYRLTAYFLPFRNADGSYINGLSFQTVYNVCQFDGELRNLIRMAIERIELSLRSKISYYHAHKYGPLGYLDGCNYNKKHDHEKFCTLIEKAVWDNRQQPFVKHHIQKYDSQFPIWVIIELLTLGELSKFYADLERADKKAIARTVYETTDQNLESWLFCLTKLRNYCAHYARLYYSKLGTVPATPTPSPYRLKDRAFDYILLLKLLYPTPETWRQDFVQPLLELLDQYKGSVEINHLGFPYNYIELLE